MHLEETLLTTPQHEFIKNHLDETFHPAFIQPEVQYDRAKKKFVLKPDNADCPPEIHKLSAIYAAAETARRDFLTKVLKRPSATAAPKDVIRMDSWEGVLDLVDEAVRKYSLPGKVRSRARTFSDSAPAIQAWMSLFPDTCFSSTLCSGIIMVLNVAAKIKSLREQVLGMLSEIPDHLAKTDLYVRLHKGVDSERIHKESSALYITLLEAVKLMLDWLNQKPGTKILKGIFRSSDDYGKEIQVKLADIEKIAGRVAEEAVICSQRKTNQVYDSITNQTLFLENMDTNIDQKLNGISSRMALFSLDIQNAMLDHLAGSPKIPTEIKPLRRVATRKSYSQAVIKFLGFSAELVSRDLRTCFREGQASNAMTKDRVNMVLKSPEFAGWLSKPTSSTLLINGHSESTFISPMSHLCAFFGEALNADKRRVPNGIYFCGLRGKDRSCDASDLVKSLIGQLMSWFEFDFSFLKGKQPKKLNTPKQLCRLLRRLLKQLPADKVLIWIVDGVSWFEGSKRVEATRIIFGELIRMTRECENVVIKLLITSPNRSKEVALLCEKETVLNVPTYVEGERQGTLAMKFGDAVGIIGRPE